MNIRVQRKDELKPAKAALNTNQPKAQIVARNKGETYTGQIRGTHNKRTPSHAKSAHSCEKRAHSENRMRGHVRATIKGIR